MIVGMMSGAETMMPNQPLPPRPRTMRQRRIVPMTVDTTATTSAIWRLSMVARTQSGSVRNSWYHARVSSDGGKDRYSVALNETGTTMSVGSATNTKIEAAHDDEQHARQAAALATRRPAWERGVSHSLAPDRVGERG